MEQAELGLLQLCLDNQPVCEYATVTDRCLIEWSRIGREAEVKYHARFNKHRVGGRW